MSDSKRTEEQQRFWNEIRRSNAAAKHRNRAREHKLPGKHNRSDENRRAILERDN
jgi:hypothetical protein